jgi:putative ABC transport system permease protein
MIRLILLIVRNVARNRRRNVLTLLSSAISLALLSLLVAMFQGFFYGDGDSPAQASRLICRHHVSLIQPLPASHLQRIRSVPGVARVTPWTWFGGTYKEPSDFFGRFAVSADDIFEIRKDWSAPVAQIAAFKRERTACAVSKSVADKYHFKIGDRITIVGDIYAVTLELTVAAIFTHPINNDNLIFHQEYLNELLPVGSAQRDTVGTYMILAKSTDDVPRIARAVDAMFANSPYPTRTESEKEFERSFLAFLGNIKMFLLAVCGAVTFTILLVSANTIAMSVRERTRELAILRTLGYTPSEILQLILGESVLISAIGGVLGLFIGVGLAKGLEAGGADFGFPGIRWQAAAVVMSMAILIGLLAAAVPAVVASRKNVVESLRFIG